MIFESPRLTFRLMQEEDIDALYVIWGNSETMRFCGGTVSKEAIRNIIKHNITQYKIYENAVFAIAANEMLIGICGGKLEEENPLQVELIIHLAKEFWHQGFATEAVKAYIAWLIAGNKVSYLYASVHPDNHASINMIKKCGLIQNGFRQYEDTGFVDEPYFELYYNLQKFIDCNMKLGDCQTDSSVYKQGRSESIC